MKRFGRFVDSHWPPVLWITGAVLVGGGYWLWTTLADKNPLLARLSEDVRAGLYGSLAASAGALLGFTIASLAILFTLDPSRGTVQKAQAHRAWGMLNRTLLVAAASLALLLLAATTALAIDTEGPPKVGIEIAVFTLAAISFMELLVGGVAFALVVLAASTSE